MDNMIQIDSVDEESTNILLQRFVQRYRKEKGRLLTEHETNICWWSICGAVMTFGYEAGKRFVDNVKLG